MADTADELIDELRDRDESEAILNSFAIVFDVPMPPVRVEQLRARTCMKSLRNAHASSRIASSWNAVCPSVRWSRYWRACAVD